MKEHEKGEKEKGWPLYGQPFSSLQAYAIF
jgi:hypothetical protein